MPEVNAVMQIGLINELNRAAKTYLFGNYGKIGIQPASGFHAYGIRGVNASKAVFNGKHNFKFTRLIENMDKGC